MWDLEIGQGKFNSCSSIACQGVFGDFISSNAEEYWINLDMDCLNASMKVKKDCPEGKKISSYIKRNMPLRCKLFIVEIQMKNTSPSQFVEIVKNAKTQGIEEGKRMAQNKMIEALGLTFRGR